MIRPGPPGASLDEVILAVTGVVSLGRVDIVGIPTKAEIGDLQVLVGIEGGDEAALPVDQDEIGPYFYAPLHPITPNQGGPVLIQVTDGVQRSPELPLDLEALPEAPGAFELVVTALRAQIDQLAAWVGTDFEALAAMPYDEVDLALLPLRAAVGYLDGEDLGDLQNLVTDVAGYMMTDERELLDRVFGHAPLDELIQAEVDSFASGGLPPPPPPGATKSTLDCFDVGPSITTAEQLSHAMIASARAGCGHQSGQRARSHARRSGGRPGRRWGSARLREGVFHDRGRGGVVDGDRGLHPLGVPEQPGPPGPASEGRLLKGVEP